MSDRDQSAGQPSHTSELKPMTDSPWFWVYLFATAGLISLVLVGNKFDHRQSEIEREFSTRQSYGHVISGPDGPIEPPTPGNQHLTLRPLYIVMAVILVIGWLVFYIKRLSSAKRSAI